MGDFIHRPSGIGVNVSRLMERQAALANASKSEDLIINLRNYQEHCLKDLKDISLRLRQPGKTFAVMDWVDRLQNNWMYATSILKSLEPRLVGCPYSGQQELKAFAYPNQMTVWMNTRIVAEVAGLFDPSKPISLITSNKKQYWKK